MLLEAITHPAVEDAHDGCEDVRRGSERLGLNGGVAQILDHGGGCVEQSRSE